ncbi:YjbA family protein [Virgibacillus halophilus]|uniref:YjbA family protein n=1 Tax=Tigheibacillus halophilus TaxID=361280 RepID=UPI0036320777
MLYLHDVWVNWFEGEENGYSVCHFHEWRKEDKIELLDQVPLLYITTPLFNYIENDMQDLPKALLDTIHKRAFIRKGPQRNVLEYACVITDGNDVLALDTVGYQIPIRKSRIIPRQEMLVYDMIENTKQQNFRFDEKSYQKEYHMLSMSPELIYGLTRRERQLKQLLMMALDQLKTSDNLEELRYWLTEWDPKQYPYIRYMDENQAWDSLYEGVKHGWSQAHEELCHKLVKGQPFLEKIWELENDQANQKQKSKNQ